MLLSEMVLEVQNIIQDSTFDTSIEGYINEAFLQASGRVNIPDLKRVGLAETVEGQMFTPLYGIDGGFSGRLSKVLDTSISRFNSIEDLLDTVMTESRDITEVGPVEYVALEGRTLWYFPTPEVAQTIQCILFNNPTVMEFEDESPNEFPEICHRNIGIHGACFLAFQIIEDGIDGDKVNTNHHFTMYEKGIVQLVEWIGRHRPHVISSRGTDTLISTNSWNSTFSRWENAR